MSQTHLILEIHCLYGINEHDGGPIPPYCKYGAEKPGYHCMENGCKCAAFAPAPHEIAFAGEDGEVPHNAWIGFGGDMEPENISQAEVLSLRKLWEEVCRDNIDKSYDDYMKKSELDE